MKISIRAKLALMFIISTSVFSVIGIFLIWRLWDFSAAFYRDMPSAYRSMSRAEEQERLARNIRYYDEVLTQSARNYAFTSDRAWMERYNNNEPILDSMIKKAKNQGDEIDRRIFDGIDDANMALVRMEREAIKAVDEARTAEAISLLESADYKTRKAVYGNGLDNYFQRREREAENAKGATLTGFENILRKKEELLNLLLISVLVFIISSVLIFVIKYFMISKMLIRPLVVLQKSAKKVADGDINQHVYVNTGDEIEDVANEFNAMVSGLGSLISKNEVYIRELEETNAKLTEKDKQLSELNKNLEDLRLNLEEKVDERTKYLTSTQQAVLNIMGDLQDSKKEVDQANIIIRKAYEEIKDTQARLVQAEKMSALGRFSSGIAHEVKNPLAIMLGGMEYLQKKLETADLDTKTALEKIKDAVFRADRVIQNLLRFARPAKMEFEKVKLRDIVSEAVTFFKYKASLANINIDVKLPEKPIFVSVDKNQIQQVIFNLISNSVDAMPRGGEITINIFRKEMNSSGVDEPYGVVEIVDTGGGMTETDMGRLWEPFFTTKRDKGGTGLGLAVSKSIIENHKGFIEIESEYRKGTVARIILPMLGG